MTNPVAVVGLTFGGTDIQQSDFGIFLEVVRGLNEPPAARGVDLVVPARAGRVVRNRVMDALSIELRGYVMGALSGGGERVNYRNNVQAVRALFDPAAEPANLVASLEDATTQTVAARTLNSVWNEITPGYAEVSIELQAVEDWHA